MARCADTNPVAGDVLIRLVSSLTTALWAYQIRATECGQKLKHMVLLEAAVQGWRVTASLLGFSHSISQDCMHLWQGCSAASRPRLAHRIGDAVYVQNVFRLQHAMADSATDDALSSLNGLLPGEGTCLRCNCDNAIG